MMKYILNFIQKIGRFLTNLAKKLESKYEVTIKDVYFDTNDRSRTFIITNNQLRTFKIVLNDIFQTLQKDVRFTSFGKNKVIILSGFLNKGKFQVHHNVLINNSMTFEEYWSLIEDDLYRSYENEYLLDEILIFQVQVWNMDKYVNKKIKITMKAGKIFHTVTDKETKDDNNKN